MAKLTWVLGLGIMIGAAGCAADVEETTESAGSMIVGGNPTSAEPAVGALIWLNDGGFVCSGFLVAPQIVLTAAHCASRKELPVGFFTGPGARRTTPPKTLAEITGFTRHLIDRKAVHPLWTSGTGDVAKGTLAESKKKFLNDFGLYRLAQPLAITPLPFAPRGPAVWTKCTAIGYGFDAEKGTTGALAKRSGAVNVFSNGTFIGAGTADAEPNKGDSGSPLLCSGRVAGVYSFNWYADARTPQNDSDYYVSVNGDLINWIDRTAATWGVAKLP